MVLLKSAEAALFFANDIGKTLFGFMMRTDKELDLASSMDVLISTELRN